MNVNYLLILAFALTFVMFFGSQSFELHSSTYICLFLLILPALSGFSTAKTMKPEVADRMTLFHFAFPALIVGGMFFYFTIVLAEFDAGSGPKSPIAFSITAFLLYWLGCAAISLNRPSS